MRRSVRALPLALALLLAAPAAAEDVRLRLQAGFPFAQPVLGEMIVAFRDAVARSGRSDLRVRVYDAGKLVPTLQIFDAVSAGKLDGGFAWPGYWMGMMPAVTVFAAVPFGPEADEFLAWIYEGGGLELWRALYARHDAVPIPCGVLPPEASGWFRKPIEKPDDLRGLKIRYAGLGGKVLEKLGASITMLSSGDIFVALERGVLDATEYSMPVVDRSLGFHKVAKHYYFPGWHQPSSIMELALHKPVWDALAPEQRNFLEETCRSNVLTSLTRGQGGQNEALDFFRAEGVQIHRWSPEMMAAFEAAAEEVMDEAAAGDAAFAEAWASLRAFREAGAGWRSLALP